MDILEFLYRFAENQGILALLLLIMMAQNYQRYRQGECLKSEMARFIMKCLEEERQHDHKMEEKARFDAKQSLVDPFQHI